MEAKEEFTKMMDLELQQRCIAAGQKFVDVFFKGQDDVTRTLVLNGVSAGYSKGYRDAWSEAIALVQKELNSQKSELAFVMGVTRDKVTQFAKKRPGLLDKLPKIPDTL